jgi:hypothetical protein
VRVWTTSLELKTKLTEGAPIISAGSAQAELTLRIDAARRYQTMLGWALLWSTRLLEPLAAGRADSRTDAPPTLGSGGGIGMNLMRICIGTSDFAGEDGIPTTTCRPDRPIRS